MENDNAAGKAAADNTNTADAAKAAAATIQDPSKNAAPAASTDNKANASDAAPKQPGWMAQLKADLKANNDLAKFDNVNDLCTALLDAHGKLANVLPLLPKDATEEQKAAFFNKLGRPEKPEGYVVDKSPLPDGMAYDDAMEQYFRPIAHAMGYTQEQFAAGAKAITEYNIALQTKLIEATQKSVADYQRAWGDKAPANFEKIQRVTEKVGSKAFIELMDRAECDGVKFGNHPAVVDMLLKLHDVIGEDHFVAGGGNSGQAPANVTGEPQFKYE